MENFPYLPEDMLIEIFLRLPPESLLRFKYVKKSWYTLITALMKDPKFVAKHLHMNSQHKEQSLLFKCFDDVDIGSLAIYNDKEHLSYIRQDFKPLLSKNFKKLLSNNLIGASHCDGLICLTDYDEDRILLCNPAIKESKLLPSDPCYHKTDAKLVNVGFGYDSVAEVYKVVKVCAWMTGEFRAHVYTLGKDHVWRDIKMETEINDDPYALHASTEVHCNGVSYWLMMDEYTGELKMLSFDMRDEEFHTITLPRPIEDMVYSWPDMARLTQWNDSVVLFLNPRSSSTRTKSIQMWVLEGRKKSWRWKKLLSIGPLRGIDKNAIAFWKGDEVLIKESGKGLFSYNILTGKVRRIYKGDVSQFHGFCYYVQSIVSVNTEGI